MKRNVLSAVILTCVSILVPLAAFASNYVKSDAFKQWLETGKPMVIIDIQPAEDYAKQHFKGSIETNAFPAKTEEEKKRLDKVIPKIQSSKNDVVIICPRGRSGASNTYDYLKARGVAESRLFILEGGIAGWPYPDRFTKER
jgi:rhodanese-related sulfurtransferase